jgi:transposase-like protein
MTTLLTENVKEELAEMIINRDEVKFIDNVPTCPKCKHTYNIIYLNVTKEIYKCIKCNQRFHFA